MVSRNNPRIIPRHFRRQVALCPIGTRMERDYFPQQTLDRFSRLGDVLVREVGEAPYQRLEPPFQILQPQMVFTCFCLEGKRPMRRLRCRSHPWEALCPLCFLPARRGLRSLRRTGAKGIPNRPPLEEGKLAAWTDYSMVSRG